MLDLYDAAAFNFIGGYVASGQTASSGPAEPFPQGSSPTRCLHAMVMLQRSQRSSIASNGPRVGVDPHDLRSRILSPFAFANSTVLDIPYVTMRILNRNPQAYAFRTEHVPL